MLDRIIIGLDNNETYWGILPLVYKAWKKFFPKVNVTVATVGINLQLVKYCDSISGHPEIKKIPSANQAKLIRFYEATKYPDEIIMINDVDLIPLQTEYYLSRLSKRKKGELLAVGRNIYKGTKHEGKFPLGFCTAEGYIFKQIINPKELAWIDFVKSFVNFRMIDEKEAVNKPFKSFSDESLIRALLIKWKGIVCDTDYYPISKLSKYCISRHHSINIKRLRRDGYTEAHHLIPASNWKDRIKAVADYLEIDFDFDWMKR